MSNMIKNSKQFLTESNQELKKVVWPNKQQAIQSTWVVIFGAVLLSVFLGLIDWGLAKLIGFLIK